jgi:hypothetical protein
MTPINKIHCRVVSPGDIVYRMERFRDLENSFIYYCVMEKNDNKLIGDYRIEEFLDADSADDARKQMLELYGDN